MQLLMKNLESPNTFKKCLDFTSLNAMKCDCGTIFYASCTKPASHKRIGIYLSNFSELTIKFTNILNFLIGESYTCVLNKPVYV